MPKLETYTASGQIRGGPVAAEQGVQDQFAGALARTSGALFGASQDASQIAQIVEQRNKENDFKWNAEAATQYKDELIKWQSDLNNQGEDVGFKFRQFADERMAEYLKKAPNSRAGEIFKSTVMPSVQAQWKGNLEHGENIRFQNFKTAQTSLAIKNTEAYRQQMAGNLGSKGVPETLILDSLTQQLAQIEVAYGKTSPANAAAMMEDTVADYVSGVMATDPVLARELLDKHQVVDPKRRATLLASIDRFEQSGNALARTNFTNAIADDKANAEMYRQPMPERQKAEFIAAYGSADVGEAAWTEYNRVKEQRNAVMSYREKVKGKNLSVAAAELQKASSLTGETGAYVAAHAGRIYDSLVDVYDKDKAAYTRLNPHVQSFYKMADEAPPHLKQMFSEMAFEMQLAYQGNAPADADEEQKQWYLGLSSVEKSLLPKKNAKDLAQTLNQGKPSERREALMNFEQEFGKFRDIAWRDLARLPDGEKVEPEMQLAALNINSPWLNQYLSAIQDPKAASALSKEEYNAYEKALFTSTKGNWAAFVSLNGGDGGQNNPTLVGFKRGLVAYALSLKDGSPDEKMARSFDTLIGSKFAFKKINDQTLSIAKYRPNNESSRTDEEVESIASALNLHMRGLDPQQIDPKNAAIFQNLPVEGQGRVMSYYTALSNLMLAPKENGQGMYLYFKTDSGVPVQMMDRQGKPIYYDYDNPSQTNWPLKKEFNRATEQQRSGPSYIPLPRP